MRGSRMSESHIHVAHPQAKQTLVHTPMAPPPSCTPHVQTITFPGTQEHTQLTPVGTEHKLSNCPPAPCLHTPSRVLPCLQEFPEGHNQTSNREKSNQPVPPLQY
ncbi:hypothetical protein B0O80DRAFT_153517 [Mortierella sp. GBAus27b]|nr:hypothetical protein B0O80DRAFT_153517 [Mortierella sp. GBAus27b]